MVWFVCKMRLWHMCTFASENLTVKELRAKATRASRPTEHMKTLCARTTKCTEY